MRDIVGKMGFHSGAHRRIRDDGKNPRRVELLDRVNR